MITGAKRSDGTVSVLQASRCRPSLRLDVAAEKRMHRPQGQDGTRRTRKIEIGIGEAGVAGEAVILTAAWENHTCILSGDLSVRCSGGDFPGQLGDGSAGWWLFPGDPRRARPSLPRVVGRRFAL